MRETAAEYEMNYWIMISKLDAAAKTIEKQLTRGMKKGKKVKRKTERKKEKKERKKERKKKKKKRKKEKKERNSTHKEKSTQTNLIFMTTISLIFFSLHKMLLCKF